MKGLKVINSGTVKRIHVSQVNLRANRKDGGKRPVFTIQTSNGPLHASYVKIKGSSEIENGTKPLSCGAWIWIKTKARIEYIKV
jgi:hypothetical protein